MKRLTLISLLLSLTTVLFAQKQEIAKKGLNFGPLPAIAYDADKGFQYGAILMIYDYGDGHNYPNYDNKTYLEYSRFTKGSQLIQVHYDDKELIPNTRWSTALKINLDKAFDFYGFNGYGSFYDYDRIVEGKEGGAYGFTPFYRMKKNDISFKSDFIGAISQNLKWEAGVFVRSYRIGEIDYASINKGKDEASAYPENMPTLYSLYRIAGVISEEEAGGGI